MSGEYKELENRMQKTIEVLIENYDTLRAGRANPGVLNKISVEYYGVQTPLNQVASIAAPEPRLLTIQPWDASLLKAIEKAILTSDLGINPQNDGRIIRLAIPSLTEERRRDLIKQVKKFAEESKVAIRNIRRDAMDGYKAQKKKSEITEDDYDDIEKDIQNLTDKYIKEIDGIASDKEAELLEV